MKIAFFIYKLKKSQHNDRKYFNNSTCTGCTRTCTLVADHYLQTFTEEKFQKKIKGISFLAFQNKRYDKMF